MNELDERAQGWLDTARSGHNPSSADAARIRAALKARVIADPELLEPKPVSRLVPRALHKLLGVFGAGAVLGFGAGIYVARASLPAQPLAAAPIATAPSNVSAAAPSANGGVTSESGGTVASNADTTSDADADHGAGAPGSVRDSASAARESASPAQETLTTHRGAPEAARRGTRAPAEHEHESDEKPPSPLKAELDGLRRAQELVHQNEPAWALARLEELDRAQVGSVLLEERAATRAMAECMLGHPGAQREFSERFPGSPHAEQVRASCERTLSNGTTPGGHAARQTESPSSRHE